MFEITGVFDCDEGINDAVRDLGIFDVLPDDGTEVGDRFTLES